MLRVLIIEDHVRLLRHLVDYLAAFPTEFDVRAARRPEEARRLSERQPFDVVVADLDLPATGPVAWLRETCGLSPKTKVVAMTAFCTPEIRTRVSEEEAADLIEKPFDMEHLRRALLGLADGNGARGVESGR